MTIRTSGNVVHSSTYHVVWCPKYRKRVLTGQVKTDLENIIRELADEKDSIIIEMDIQADSVHLVIDVPPQYGVAEFIKNAKGRSARVLRSNYSHLTSSMPSLWTNSYFVATTGSLSEDSIDSYIAEQKLRGE